jgi:hypothetical protein
MSTKDTAKLAKSKEEHQDASASESDDTEIDAEDEAPVGQGDVAEDDDSTTSMDEDGDAADQQAPSLGKAQSVSTTAGPSTSNSAGVPDFKTARKSKASSYAKSTPKKRAGTSKGAINWEDNDDHEEPELVSGKRHAAAMAHEIIHATSAAGQAKARVASAQARAIEEKKKARKRAASAMAKEAIAAGSATGPLEPPAKRARKSATAAAKATEAATTTKKARSRKSTPIKLASASTKKGASAKSASASTKKSAAAAKPASSSSSTKKPTAAKSGKSAGSKTKASAPAKTAKPAKKSAPRAPAPKKAAALSAPKKLPLKDAHTKYRARLAVMPSADFAIFDGAWLSVFEPTLRKRASFPEGHFSPKWTQILAEVAREKGALIKGVLPHYSTTIEGTDGLKAYEKMPQIVDKHRGEAYAAAGFDQVTPGRIYVGPAMVAAGVAESPFAFLHSDTIDDAFWQSVKKVLDADSSTDDLIDVVQHGSEAADVEVAA